MEAQLATHLAKIDIAQLEINKAEASHRSVFVAGWRPFIGWTCGVALAYTYVIQPILVFILAQVDYLITLPKMDNWRNDACSYGHAWFRWSSYI